MTDIRKVFANRLKEARMEMDLDQPEFGERLGGLSVQMLSQYENGHAMASHKTFSKILEATGKPLAWFFLRPGEILEEPGGPSTVAQALDVISQARAALDRATELLEASAPEVARRKRGATRTAEEPTPSRAARQKKQHGTP